MSSSTLKTAKSPMRRLETSLDGDHLLGKSSRAFGRNRHASLPPLIAEGLDGLTSGNGVAREILCTRGEEKSEKSEAGL